MASHETQTAPITSSDESIGQNKRKQRCRFFSSKSGCRAGNACPYLHDSPQLIPQIRQRNRHNGTLPSVKPEIPADIRQTQTVPQNRSQGPTVAQTRVVTKPVPKAQVEDPRAFQLGQIRRRYSPKEEPESAPTTFFFRLTPSDPDFPYDIEALECVLTVPLGYPANGKPKLRVTNKEMQRGFQLNVEQGFDEIAANSPSNTTLLSLLNRLDRDLDGLLSRPMAQTIKLYRNLETTKPIQMSSSNEPDQVAVKTTAAPTKQWQSQTPLTPTFTAEQKAHALAKRHADIRQLVARLGKLPAFKQSTDGVTFTVPFTPLKKANLPTSLQNVNTIRLIVPELYSLVPCRVEFPGVRDDESCKAVEQSFVRRVQEDKNATLLSHINYMSQHLAVMSAIKPVAEKAKVEPSTTKQPDVVDAAPTTSKPTNAQAPLSLPDRSHVHVIPRPPEWAHARKDDEQDDWSSDDSYSYDSGDDIEEDEEDEAGQTNAAANAPTTGPAERGILLSFPALELYGIELLELSSLSITVKCLRCKETQDIERMKNNVQGDHTGMKEVICKKCANSIAAGFRQDLIHTNSSRAGYIDLDGCTPVDMLPSTFVPTCSECSTPYKTGCVSVRGESTLAICRECHRKMTFRIPDIKFLTVSAASERATKSTSRKKARENLGIVAGQELPRRGRCTHYAKSYRWFRFSCCSKVFSCDRCHDESSDHPNEHANRMICGYCSREQNYRPEDCGICHSVLIGKKGRGFWEGGKGTRDKLRMSRKDPRKYKRRPGSKVGGGGGGS